MKRMFVLIIAVLFSTAYASEIFWLRGSDETIDIKGKKEYSLLEIKPTKESTPTKISFVSEGKIAEVATFYRGPLGKDINVFGPATLWISNIEVEGKPKIRFSIIDFNLGAEQMVVIAQSDWKEAKNNLQFETTAEFEPYNLNGKNMLKVSIEADAKKGDKISFSLDKAGKGNLTWVSKDETEVKLEEIESSGLLFFNAEGLPQIKCKNSYECSDGNVMTIDVCYFPGTYSSYCGNEIGECKISCYSDENCKEFDDGKCENPGTCNSKCYYFQEKQKLLIKLLSPDKEEYKKGAFVRVAGRVSALDGEKVFGVKVTAETDTGIIVPMREVELGLFEGFFQIPNRTNNGNIKITIKAEKEGFYGSETATIRATPPKITIYFETNRKRDIGNATLIITKSKDSFEIGEKIELTARALYENGEPVITDNVYATIGGEIVKLFPKDRGVYSAEHTIYETTQSEIEVKVHIDDGFNNLAEYSNKIKISKGSFLNFIIENSTNLAIAIVIVSILIIIVSKALNKAKELTLLMKKEKEITEKIKKLQTKYYLERTIDKKSYEREMKTLEPKLKETKAKIKEIKKSIKLS